ncbi:MAG: helix-turn-helix domain-containing protein [Alicyclobacillus sp.]|nr:helix-turn-helix domain-containing protein [Alicyclobacillus sp.]
MGGADMGRTLGERLRELRLSRDLSQADLGRHFRVAKQTISNYETGHSSPTPDQLQAFADFFHVSVDYLLGRTDIRQPLVRQEQATFQETDPDVAVLFRDAKDLLPEDREELAKFIEWLRHRRTGSTTNKLPAHDPSRRRGR